MYKVIPFFFAYLFLTACGGSSSESTTNSTSNTGTAYVVNLKFDADAIKNRTLFDLYNNSKTTPTNFFPFYITLDNALNMQIGDGFNPSHTSDYSQFTYIVNSNGYLEISSSTSKGIIKPIEMIDNLSVKTEYCDLDSSNVESNCETGYLFDTQASAETYIDNNATSKTAIDTDGLVNKISSAITSKKLSYTEQVKILDGSSSSITDISFVSNFPYLETLYLYENTISDLTEIANLTQLEVLSLFDNRITNISPLNNLTSIKKLYLEFQYDENNVDLNISDYTPIYTLTNLTSLSLEEYGVTLPIEFNLSTFINGLADKNALNSLVFGNMKFDNTDITAISGVNNLSTLSIYNDSITDLSTVIQNNRWDNLTHLVLENNSTLIFNLNDMISNGLDTSKLIRLRLYDVTFDTDDLVNLTASSLSNLDNLGLRSTNISSHTSLTSASIENLTYLRLSEAGIDFDFNSLSQLNASKVEYLYLRSFNSITNLNFNNYTSLDSLNLLNTDLSDISITSFNEELAKLSKLEKIRIYSLLVNGATIACSDLTLPNSATCLE